MLIICRKSCFLGPLSNFREFLTRTMSESLILFDQEFYKQHDGGAMVSPLGPALANVFFVIMKKFGFKIVYLNLNLLSIEGTLMIHSYFLLEKSHQKISKLFKSST